MNTPNSKYAWKTVFCIRNLHPHVSTWPQWSILFPCSLYGIFCTTTSTFILHQETLGQSECICTHIRYLHVHVVRNPLMFTYKAELPVSVHTCFRFSGLCYLRTACICGWASLYIQLSCLTWKKNILKFLKGLVQDLWSLFTIISTPDFIH